MPTGVYLRNEKYRNIMSNVMRGKNKGRKLGTWEEQFGDKIASERKLKYRKLWIRKVIPAAANIRKNSKITWGDKISKSKKNKISPFKGKTWSQIMGSENKANNRKKRGKLRSI